MAKSGRSVKSEIESIANNLYSEYSAVNSKVEQYECSIKKVSSEREDILLRLAKTYLSELDADNIQRTLKEVQAEVQSIFKQKQQRRTEFTSIMEESEEKRETLQKKVNSLIEKLNDKVARRDELSAKAGAELKRDPTYKPLTQRANSLRSDLEKDEKILKSTTADFAQKRKAIESNNFSKYLLNSKYDPEHQRFFDGWIAKAVACNNDNKQPIGFVEVKKAYDYLKRMPELMKKNYEERVSQLEALEVKINKAEKAASDAVGLTKIFGEIDALITEKKKTESQVDSEVQTYGRYAAEKKSMENTKGQYHSAAVQKLKTFLKSQQITDLKARARATPCTEDDSLVNRIEEIDREVRKLKDGSKTTRAKAEDMSDLYNGIRRILNKFDNNGYASSRSYFSPGLEMDSYLSGYICGKYSERVVWNHIESRHHIKPVESYSSYSGSSYGGPSSSSSPSSSHRSGGGFGGGSGFGGGGFGGGARIGGRGF